MRGECIFVISKQTKAYTNLIFFPIFESSDCKEPPASVSSNNLRLSLALPPPELVTSDDAVLRFWRWRLPSDDQGLGAGRLQGHVLRGVSWYVRICSTKKFEKVL